MKHYTKPQLETIELETESSIMTDSNHPATDYAGFGDPSDEID